MKSIALKVKIKHFLKTADEKVLNIVGDGYENYNQNKNVAFYSDLKPRCKQEHNIAIGSDRVKAINLFLLKSLKKNKEMFKVV
ncbi:MAG: hypothetical protein ACJAYY_003148 [Paraglaciecola sp.]|jgi:hypothetical protein|uniref:hypothetical protein n=1 Tax=Polaribacter sp. TaxID=1920175 RepID=UPI003AD5C923